MRPTPEEGMAAATPGSNLGFLTILQDTSGYLGGYLVTNAWGRPLEFRLSTAVQPNRVQQILYGATLEPYLCADLIGKTLLDKTTTSAQVVITDHPAVLELRGQVDIPVGLLDAHGLPSAGLRAHPQFPEDDAALRGVRERDIDLAEPFARIRDAIAEARKLGVTARA
jgi:hypothetical protein